jgi:hypothetical protein
MQAKREDGNARDTFPAVVKQFKAYEEGLWPGIW